MNIQQAILKIIEATGDPQAPHKIDKAYKALDQLGATLTRIARPKIETISGIQDKLVQAWPEAEFDIIADKPEFILAMVSMLMVSLENYGRSLVFTDYCMHQSSPIILGPIENGITTSCSRRAKAHQPEDDRCPSTLRSFT